MQLATGNFLIDDEKLAVESWRQPVPLGDPPRSRAIDRQRMIKAMRHELQTVAIQTAATLSALEVAAHDPVRGEMAACEIGPWLPASPRVIGHPDLLLDSELPLSTINLLGDVDVLVRMARRAVLGALRPAGGAGVADRASLERAIPFWQTLAGTLLDLLREFGEPDAPSTFERRRVSAERLLVATLLGTAPCVDNDGRIEIPGWIERRGGRRQRMTVAGRLVARDRSWPVVTTDLSKTGAGLVHAPPLAPPAKIILELEGFAPVAATLVWQRGDRSGVKFEQNLTPMRPIF